MKPVRCVGRRRCAGSRLFVLCAACGIAASASAQLRVATWNVTNYSGGRVAEFQTSIYGAFEGRSLAPDVLIGQEFLSQSGVNQFLAILNTAPGSPGDWAAAPFINGPDTDNAFFYRTSRVELLSTTVIATGGPAPNHPRDVNRYDIRPVGYSGDGAVIACYSSHMKAGSGSTDQQRRLLEAQRIRDDAAALPQAWSFVLGGDFNIQSSGQAAYVELTTAGDGRFWDPIATPGSWNNNGSYAIVHTQDPSGAGGMDDRHDQLLLSTHLVDSVAMEYVGNPTIPYSTTTWNDPNHSYRAWGNDGTSYNVALTVSGNTMVGPDIAQALRVTAGGGGHLPVVLDLLVPGRLDAPEVIDFGNVMVGDPAEAVIEVSN
ncbi:MAG: hypothetical protein VYC34_04945, partial [Planctomycetota bacterium]|nr:hypothetical protein [Planctomycetota bacterium]